MLPLYMIFKACTDLSFGVAENDDKLPWNSVFSTPLNCHGSFAPIRCLVSICFVVLLCSFLHLFLYQARFCLLCLPLIVSRLVRMWMFLISIVNPRSFQMALTTEVFLGATQQMMCTGSSSLLMPSVFSLRIQGALFSVHHQNFLSKHIGFFTKSV